MGVDPAARIANDERGAGGLAILIDDAENDLRRGNAIEEDIHLVPEAEILGSLANVEFDLGLALTGIAGIDLDNSVFKAETGEGPVERTGIKSLDVHPAVPHLGLRDTHLRIRSAA